MLIIRRNYIDTLKIRQNPVEEKYVQFLLKLARNDANSKCPTETHFALFPAVLLLILISSFSPLLLSAFSTFILT